ncbi:MAG: hypothetical protein QM770_19640 [Tepidisphaeraceae bacterium]
MACTGWAAYLAASWTWCIGMFLPVLLIRDFGSWGWVVFALPNVIGAAAMGWTIRSRDHSLSFVTNHRLATAAFSYVTIAFHVFFVIWMFSQLVGTVLTALAFGALLTVLLPIFVTNLAVTALAMLTLCVSVIAVVISAAAGGLRWPQEPPTGGAFDIVALAGVCILGFTCCPYLDLTFHRARQECAEPEQSRTAFGVGFGMFFFAMIVFTLFYARGFIDRSIWTSPLMRGVLATHLLVQAMFTVGVHADALAGSTSTIRGHRHRWEWLTATILVPAAMALISIKFQQAGKRYGPMEIGEVCYRTFMSFYGLLAPAYVWICVWPGRGYTKPNTRAWTILALACTAAAPFFWISFMNAAMGWVLIGIAIVIGARWLLDRDSERRDFLREARSEIPLGSYDPQHPR